MQEADELVGKTERRCGVVTPFSTTVLGRPPVRWWRFHLAQDFTKAAVRDTRASLAKLEILREPRWADAAAGYPAAAVGIGFRFGPHCDGRLEFDLAMTALALCGLDGDAAACLTMSYFLPRVPGADGAETRVARSWKALTASDRRRATGDGA
jgi:hypothetical protein